MFLGLSLEEARGQTSFTVFYSVMPFTSSVLQLNQIPDGPYTPHPTLHCLSRRPLPSHSFKSYPSVEAQLKRVLPSRSLFSGFSFPISQFSCGMWSVLYLVFVSIHSHSLTLSFLHLPSTSVHLPY